MTWISAQCVQLHTDFVIRAPLSQNVSCANFGSSGLLVRLLFSSLGHLNSVPSPLPQGALAREVVFARSWLISHLKISFRMPNVNVKWGKGKYEVLLDFNEPPLVFKSQLFALTGVPPDRQKVVVKVCYSTETLSAFMEENPSIFSSVPRW